MLSYVLDVSFVAVVIVTAYFLARRSLLESAMVWLALGLSALIALNWFEPAAAFILRHMFSVTDLWFTCFLWFATCIAIFSWLSVMILIGFHRVLDQANIHLGKFDSAGRWFFGLLSGYTLGAFLLTSLHTVPATRDFWGAFPPELHRRSGPVMGMGPDYQLLTFAEYTCDPRSALSGTPWLPRGPLVEADLRGNRWSSFPVRYAIWREAMQQLRIDFAPASSDSLKLGEEPDSEMAVLDRRLIKSL